MRSKRPSQNARARDLRREATSAEARLWSRLRARRLNGFKFVRQENIGDYFVDFVCREEKLIIEVDGATHSAPRELAHDKSREAWLIEHGFHVLRVTNAEVYENLDGVCESILDALNATAPAPSPRERGEGWGEGDSDIGIADPARIHPDDQD